MLRQSDGGLEHTYTVGQQPLGIVFDGTTIWVSNYLDDTVSKITP